MVDIPHPHAFFATPPGSGGFNPGQGSTGRIGPGQNQGGSFGPGAGGNGGGRRSNNDGRGKIAWRPYVWIIGLVAAGLVGEKVWWEPFFAKPKHIFIDPNVNANLFVQKKGQSGERLAKGESFLCSGTKVDHNPYDQRVTKDVKKVIVIGEVQGMTGTHYLAIKFSDDLDLGPRTPTHEVPLGSVVRNPSNCLTP